MGTSRTQGILATDLSFPKIFVTGIYGSGKSTIANTISQHTNHPYQDFDRLWNYSRVSSDSVNNDIYATSILNKLGTRFITDAIPFNLKNEFYFSFNKFYKIHESDILIICALCHSIEEWLSRIALKRRIKKQSQQHHIAKYVDFHTRLLPMHNARNILYYETTTQKYISQAAADDFIENLDHDN